MTRRRTDTIPRVDDIAYLFETLGGVRDGLTFDQVRAMLIVRRRHSDQEKLLDHRSGLTALRRLERNDQPMVYWSNAKDALRELMRLGMVSPAPLPTSVSQVDAHKGRQYALTPEGGRFLELASKDPWEFRDRFYQSMDAGHPYLRRLRRRLVQGNLFFPRVQKADLPGNVEAWYSHPPQPLDALVKKLAEGVNSAQGILLEPEKLVGMFTRHLRRAWRRRNQSLHPREYSKWVVKTVNDVTVRLLASAYGIPLDHVTFRASLSILDELHVAWQTRSLADRVGWTAWLTANGEPPEHRGKAASPAALALETSIWLRRRRPTDEEVRDALIQAFLDDQDRKGGFALIHVLRAAVCYRLKIHGWVFNDVLRKMHAGTLRHEAFAVNLDRGSSSELPPSEEPFTVGDRSFYIITLLRRE